MKFNFASGLLESSPIQQPVFQGEAFKYAGPGVLGSGKQGQLAIWKDQTTLGASTQTENISAVGLQTETPSGAVDGANSTFTVSNTPLFLVVDGMLRINGFGYSYSGGIITTDFPPVQFIRSFY